MDAVTAASSPAVAAQSDGTVRVVFEANNDLPAEYGSGGTNPSPLARITEVAPMHVARQPLPRQHDL